MSAAGPPNWAKETAARRARQQQPTQTPPSPPPPPPPPPIAMTPSSSEPQQLVQTQTQVASEQAVVSNPFAHLDPRVNPLNAAQPSPPIVASAAAAATIAATERYVEALDDVRPPRPEEPAVALIDPLPPLTTGVPLPRLLLPSHARRIRRSTSDSIGPTATTAADASLVNPATVGCQSDPTPVVTSLSQPSVITRMCVENAGGVCNAAQPATQAAAHKGNVGVLRAVSSDETLREWKELHTSWSSAAQENRLKRERNEKSREAKSRDANLRDEKSRLNRISDPPMLFNPTSFESLMSLFLGRMPGPPPLAPPRSSSAHQPTIIHSESIRSPSGQTQQVIMMSQRGPDLFDVAPRQPVAARMVFNDRRLDSIVQRQPLNPFQNGNAASRWGDMLRTSLSNNTENALQSLMNRTLYEHQPSPASLRGGGSTLIVLPTPPSTQQVENCPICLDNDRDQQWAQFPCCKNYGHLQCSKRWLAQRMQCCVCRTLIP